MNPFEMVVAIVVIVGIVNIVKAKYGVIRTGRGREEQFVGPPVRDNAEAERLRGELAQLKERVAVLERIVTDGDRNRGMQLEREIEALRVPREPQR